MSANIGAALTRITRLYPFQIGSLALTTVFTGISAMSAYSDKVPAPETYIKATIRADGERAPTSDPKAEIKYRNNGGSPMIIKSIKIMTDGKVVDSFSDAIGPTKGKYMISSESSVFFLKKGHIDRNIKSVSSFVLCTVRPVAEALEGEEWEMEFRRDLESKKITVETKYDYFPLPLFGPILSGKKVSKLL